MDLGNGLAASKISSQISHETHFSPKRTCVSALLPSTSAPCRPTESLTRAISLTCVADKPHSKMPTFAMSAGQFDLVYNSLSFTLASMMASTIFFWLRLGSVHEQYKSAMTIT